MSNQMYESFLYEAGDLGIPSPLTCNWKEDLINYGLLNTTAESQPASDSNDSEADEAEEVSNNTPGPRIRVEVHGGILRHDYT